MIVYFHVLRRGVEYGGYLLIAYVVEVTEVEYHLLLRGESMDGVLELHRLRVGVVEILIGGKLMGFGAVRVVERHVLFFLPLQESERFVGGDSHEPRRKRFDLADAVKPLVGFDKGLLSDVLSVGMIHYKTADVVVHRFHKRIYQQPESIVGILLHLLGYFFYTVSHRSVAVTDIRPRFVVKVKCD